MEEELFTQNQAILYVAMNFSVAAILIVAVNSNMSASCAPVLKYWLITLALLLSANSLLQVFGIDIRHKPRLTQKIFTISKVVQFLCSVAWLCYGHYIFFVFGNECRTTSPILSYTMLATLVFGYLQLIMFSILLFGIIWWAICKVMGWPVSFTPASLWEDQQ